LIPAVRAGKILGDTGSGRIQATGIRAAHRCTAVAGLLVESDGTLQIPGNALSDFVHEPEYVAGVRGTAVTRFLIPTLRELSGGVERGEAEYYGQERERAYHGLPPA